jgi:peptidyl-prolyl cis-trans isomerase SurA
MRRVSFGLAVLAFGLLSVPALRAQEPANPRTERISWVVAVVGDSILTNIDLEQALLAWQASSQQPLPADPAARLRLEDELVENMIDQLLLLQAAVRDTTLRVPDQEIVQAVDGRINELRRQFGGDAALERELATARLTLQGYREQLISQQRRDAMIQRYLAKLRRERKPPPVREEEIRAFFEQNRERIGIRPPMITFRQVVIPVEPSPESLERARIRADSILELARGREDFAQLARRFSEDPGSRDMGGDLGFNRIGRFFTEFEAAIFSPYVRPGDVIGPVRTPVGLHIIKLERVRGSERQVRHILIRPEMTPADRDRARTRALEVVEKVRAGADMDSLNRAVGDPDELTRVGPWRADSLVAPYNQHLPGRTAGEVVGPIELDADSPTPKFAVVRIVEVEASRPATVDDYRTQIQQTLAQSKLMEEIISDLRRTTLIELRLNAGRGGG